MIKTIVGLETSLWLRHKAADVASGKGEVKPYPAEVAQAQHLVKVGDGDAVIIGRDVWQTDAEAIVFYSATPYELVRYDRNRSHKQSPTKNQDTFEWRYANRIFHGVMAIYEQILHSDGSLFYEHMLRVAEPDEVDEILDRLNNRNIGAYYMQWRNFDDSLPQDALELSAERLRKHLLTPSEVAELTGTAESSWRNKAAAGQLPGAFKKGKQWLLPRSILREKGVDV